MTSYDSRRGREFKVLGEPRAVATQASRQVWFVTAQTTRSVVVDGAWAQLPAAVVHAKRMGTTLSACGVRTSTWPKLWDLAFPTSLGEQCPTCLDHVVGRTAVPRRTG